MTRYNLLNFFLPTLLLITGSCNNQESSSNNILPNDSTFSNILIDKFTLQNNLDGADMSTVDSLKIVSKSFTSDTNHIKIVYNIVCSYQPSSKAPGYQTDTPPMLHKTDSCLMVRKNGIWQITKP